ncbi:MAG TPA: hypothetical protein PKD91_12280, partial [Bacteroidia bacterium]|nr:hypothetical protein [Bacteroidia bacterium]
MYTFQFIPIQGGGLPDPYGVQVENPGTYPGGEMHIVDPSGTYPTGFDMVFKTFVTVSTLLEELDDFNPAISIYPNPFSSEAILKISGEINNSTVDHNKKQKNITSEKEYQLKKRGG